jgi:hypothetical protein
MPNRYWVGGTGTWDASTQGHWAATSGGSPTGVAAPTSGDTVFFNSSSGGGTVTIVTGAICSTLTMTGFTGTLAFGSTNSIEIAGTGTIYTGATGFSVTGTPLIYVTNSTATARTITAAAVTEGNSISFNINNGGSTLTVSGSVRDLIFSGSFNGSFPNGTLTIYGNLTFNSTMTVTAGTSARTFASASGTQKITSVPASNNLDFPIIIGNGTSAGTVQLQDALNVGTSTSRTITLTSGTLDLNGFTLTNFGIFSSANTNARSIAFNGGSYKNTLTTTTTVVSMATTTGFTYTGTSNFNIAGSTATFTTTVSFSGTETNSLNINVTSGNGTVALTGTFKNINLTGFTGTLNNTVRTIYGNLIIPSTGTTLTAGANTTTFASSGTQQITSNGKTLNFPITIGDGSSTGTVQLQDALTVGSGTARTITLTSGTLDLNNLTLTHFGVFSSSLTSTRSIAFGTTGVIVNTLTGTATYWSCAILTNFTRTGKPNVQFTGTNTTASTITIQHGTTSGGSEANSMSFVFGSSPTVSIDPSNWIFDIGVLSLWGGSTGGTGLNVYGSYIGSTNYFGPLTFKSTSATARNLPNISSISTITIDGVGGSFVLTGVSSFYNFIVTNGSFSTASYNLSINKTFDFNNTNTKTITINSQLSMNPSFTGSFVGNLTGTTINLTGSTFSVNCDSSVITFDVPDLTYPSITAFIDGSAISNTTLVFGSGATTQTVTNLTLNNNLDYDSATFDFKVKLFVGSTLNVGNMTIAGNNFGSSPNYVALSSTTPGTPATLSKSSGTVTARYAKIQDSIATGGATWLAPATNGNINGGNNSGWIFGSYGASTGNFLMFF